MLRFILQKKTISSLLFFISKVVVLELRAVLGSALFWGSSCGWVSEIQIRIVVRCDKTAVPLVALW